MKHNIIPKVTIGVDLGDRYSELCAIDSAGVVKERKRIQTTRDAFRLEFGARKACRVVIEVGTHSPWVKRLLDDLNHESIVANPRQLKAIYQDARKNDKRDAEYLARLGRMDPQLLHPLKHLRGESVQKDRAIIKARDALVRARAALVNHIRGIVKSFGYRVEKSSTESFTKKAKLLPEDMLSVVEPLLGQIDSMSKQIREYDRQIERLIEEKYPSAERVSQIVGVGPLTALSFVLTIEDPERFKKSREVGPYLGLVPKKQDSGTQSPQLRITKAGDDYLRRLLVGSAHYILGPFGPDCDLRRYGESICARGGKNAKKRAIVAVARKLAVLMHRLWTTGETYEPNRHQQATENENAA